MSLDDLYREVILNHYRHPKNRRSMEGANLSIEVANPLCGDEIRLDLMVEDGRVSDVAWSGRGCSISQASASMMSEAVKGQTVEEAVQLVKAFRGMMRGVEPEIEMGDVEALRGVQKFPVRIKCAVLAWDALDQVLAEPAAHQAEGRGS